MCVGASGYALVLFLQAILYRHCPSRRMQVVKLSRKVFQSIYTTVYLTSVMRNIIAAAQPPDRVPLMVALRLDLDLGRDLGNKLFLEDESMHDRTLHYRPEGKHMTIKGGLESLALFSAPQFLRGSLCWSHEAKPQKAVHIPRVTPTFCPCL